MENLDLALKGVIVASDILNIPKPDVYFVAANQLPNPEISGMFLYKENEILFNEDWIVKSSFIEVISTCFHETRHAYQSYSVKHQINEPKEVLDKWEDELNQYIGPSNNLENNDEHYLKQSIEIDAIAFTHYIIKDLFDVLTYIPNNISITVENRFLSIYNKFKT